MTGTVLIWLTVRVVGCPSDLVVVLIETIVAVDIEVLTIELVTVVTVLVPGQFPQAESPAKTQ